MAWSTPSTWPHFAATASRTSGPCSGTVTSNSNTSMPSPSLRAVRWVSDNARPAPVSTISAPSSSAILATPNASDASVITPVITIFLPSSSPMPGNLARHPPIAPRHVVTFGTALGVEMRSMCHAVAMRIGILGGTGPAGSGLAARLASIGHDVVIGSRSKYRSMETVDELVGTWPELAERLTHGDNAAAADCELIVMATPWDSAAGTAQENEEALAGKVVVSMANALVRVNKEFQPLVPPRGSVAAHVQAAVPRCRVVAAFHHLPATELGPHPRTDRLRRADLRRRPGRRADGQRDRRRDPGLPTARRR